MRALVTGAAGFIGSQLAEALLARGDEVVGIDKYSDYYPRKRKVWNLGRLTDCDSFTFVEGDLAEIDLATPLDGVEVVFHLAGQPGIRASWGAEFDTYVHDNVLATQVLLEAAKEAALKRFVYASSSSVYGQAAHVPTPESVTPRPMSPYGVSKLAGEHLCQLYAESFDLPTVSLRYFTVFGPRQRPDMAISRFIASGVHGHPITIYGDGLQTRDFTYVDDIVTGTIACGHSGEIGEVYNLAGGAQVSVLEVVDAVGTALGRELTVEHLPGGVGEPRRTSGDTRKARSVLGFSPTTPFVEAVAAQVEAESTFPEPT